MSLFVYIDLVSIKYYLSINYLQNHPKGSTDAAARQEMGHAAHESEGLGQRSTIPFTLFGITTKPFFCQMHCPVMHSSALSFQT